MPDLARDARLEGIAAAKDCLDPPKRCGIVDPAAKDLWLTPPVEPVLSARIERMKQNGLNAFMD